jgi:Protein of unknown function (DUF3047)
VAAEGLTLTSPIGTGAVPPAPWHVVGLPRQAKPLTRFAVAELDGQRALRIEADHAYGNLVHPLPNVAAGVMSWRWRVDEPIVGADLRRRGGDDAALKVCALFALPDSKLPFVERQLLRFAEARTGEHLPTATLCYVWDASSLPHDTLLHNAFTHRVRFIVVHGTPGRWSEERHDLAADFLRAFGDESRTVPPLEGIAIGADSDNTGSHSLAWLGALSMPAR